MGEAAEPLVSADVALGVADLKAQVQLLAVVLAGVTSEQTADRPRADFLVAKLHFGL